MVSRPGFEVNRLPRASRCYSTHLAPSINSGNEVPLDWRWAGGCGRLPAIMAEPMTEHWAAWPDAA